MEEIVRITIIIPCRESDTPTITLKSLATQSYKDFKTIVFHDEGKGGNWARNKGFEKVDTEFVLFSDDDIEWCPNALETMVYFLDRFPKASYCYGRFQLDGWTVGHHHFDPIRLLKGNYISTMSLIRTKDFCGFDESIKRFQDWDIFLTMLKEGKRGVYCDELIFKTALKEGISHMNPIPLEESVHIIREKHGLE